MSKRKKGLCRKNRDNSDLGITDKYGNVVNGGHYVYIRKVNGNKCDVNVITSLEDKRGYYYLRSCIKQSVVCYTLFQRPTPILINGRQSIST